jgi:hypothetical protein
MFEEVSAHADEEAVDGHWLDRDINPKFKQADSFSDTSSQGSVDSGEHQPELRSGQSKPDTSSGSTSKDRAEDTSEPRKRSAQVRPHDGNVERPTKACRPKCHVYKSTEDLRRVSIKCRHSWCFACDTDAFVESLSNVSEMPPMYCGSQIIIN